MTTNQRIRRLRNGLAVLLISLGFGCNEHPLGDQQGPVFRGITIPLPPPSFAISNSVSVQLNGDATGFEQDRAELWESVGRHGLLTGVSEDGTFAFEPFSINPANHCLQVVASDPPDRRSDTSYYTLSIQPAEHCIDSHCSAERDQTGACLCLERHFAGCPPVEIPVGLDTSSDTTGGENSPTPGK